MAQPQLSQAYVDGSAMLSVAFGERDGQYVAQRLAGYSTLVSSILLEAEMRAAFARERLDFDTGLLSRIQWIYPTRPLGTELAAALWVCYLRSGDLLHVATALYAASDLGLDLAFITLDNDQREVAEGLGFAT